MLTEEANKEINDTFDISKYIKEFIIVYASDISEYVKEFTRVYAYFKAYCHNKTDTINILGEDFSVPELNKDYSYLKNSCLHGHFIVNDVDYASPFFVLESLENKDKNLIERLRSIEEELSQKYSGKDIVKEVIKQLYLQTQEKITQKYYKKKSHI